jgi:hypothetical protein
LSQACRSGGCRCGPATRGGCLNAAARTARVARRETAEGATVPELRQVQVRQLNRRLVLPPMRWLGEPARSGSRWGPGARGRRVERRCPVARSMALGTATPNHADQGRIQAASGHHELARDLLPETATVRPEVPCGSSGGARPGPFAPATETLGGGDRADEARSGSPFTRWGNYALTGRGWKGERNVTERRQNGNMSLQAEKALAAARTRILAERLPAPARDELIAAWTEMLEDMAEARSEGAAELVLLDFRSGVEARLAARLAPTPIERTAR